MKNKVVNVLKLVFKIALLALFSGTVLAHSGPHGNNECTVAMGELTLRLNGYQFKGSNPDRHYCRHYPHLGKTIIKIDSVTDDLSGMAVELQLLKRNSWQGLILNNDEAYAVIKSMPVQYFSKQVVSIDADIQDIDIYAIQLKLHLTTGEVIEQRFAFVVGFPFVQILVAIAVILLLFISIVFVRQLNRF